MTELESALAEASVMPVLTVPDGADATRLGETLGGSGMTVLEVTLRTPEACRAISEIKRALPDRLVGAGTVLTPEDADAACAAGADFLVSPGLTPELSAAARRLGRPFLPGIATPSEALRAFREGFATQKLFPAAIAGGVEFARSLAAPLPRVRLVPTGGVGAANLAAYLAEPNVIGVGGSWLAPPERIAAGDWEWIAAACTAALAEAGTERVARCAAPGRA